jgi:hypothetical protein
VSESNAKARREKSLKIPSPSGLPRLCLPSSSLVVMNEIEYQQGTA